MNLGKPRVFIDAERRLNLARLFKAGTDDPEVFAGLNSRDATRPKPK